ncbi:MAG TPA: hypothetical protein VFJ85_09390 [Acidimicrobiales bacterium]|nr:hypothetical protein [Acidimicrobiales bacterium]
MRSRQLGATVAVLPRIVGLGPPAWAAAGGLAVVAFASRPGNIALHLRVAAMAVAAATAILLDDDAAVTLAPSPTALPVRRSFRLAVVTVAVGGWWAAMLAVATARTAHLPAAALTTEVVALTAIAVAAALAVQRLAGDGRSGATGGIVVVAWFALSFLRISGVPAVPSPLDPDGPARLLLVAAAAGAAALLLSRDPARRR